jgi:hypothetical protein
LEIGSSYFLFSSFFVYSVFLFNLLTLEAFTPEIAVGRYIGETHFSAFLPTAYIKEKFNGITANKGDVILFCFVLVVVVVVVVVVVLLLFSGSLLFYHVISLLDLFPRLFSRPSGH